MKKAFIPALAVICVLMLSGCSLFFGGQSRSEITVKSRYPDQIFVKD